MYDKNEQDLCKKKLNKDFLCFLLSLSRYAKMWYKGVSFTSESCALIYLVDTAGTRTTTDTFTDLTKDYTLTVFYECVS